MLGGRRAEGGAGVRQAAGVGRRRSDQDRDLQAVWEQIPAIACKGLCANACGPIDASAREKQRLRERGVRLVPRAQALRALESTGTLRCPALTDTDRCLLYEDRPTICRLFGVQQAMPCPHGCRPDGELLETPPACSYRRRACTPAGTTASSGTARSPPRRRSRTRRAPRRCATPFRACWPAACSGVPTLARGLRRTPGHRDTAGVATVSAVTIERSGPAIRAALAQHTPQDCARFENELREALHRAQADLDLTDVETVLRRWHALATMAANPLSEHELTQIARVRTGDVTGLRERRDDGTWRTL